MIEAIIEASIVAQQSPWNTDHVFLGKCHEYGHTEVRH